jgi:hypothetical protein
MKMYNYEIENFVIFLTNEEVNAKHSRMRSRFLKLVSAHLNQIEEERQELIKQFSYKDENGEPQTEAKEDGSTVFKLKDIEGFQKEYTELMLEEFIIEPTGDKENMLKAIQDIILNTNKTFKGQEAADYDRFCDIVELD